MLTSNPWLVLARHHREVAWDTWSEAEARYRLRHPQAVPAAGYRLTRLDTAVIGFVLGLVVWLSWGLAAAGPVVAGGLR